MEQGRQWNRRRKGERGGDNQKTEGKRGKPKGSTGANDGARETSPRAYQQEATAGRQSNFELQIVKCLRVQEHGGRIQRPVTKACGPQRPKVRPLTATAREGGQRAETYGLQRVPCQGEFFLTAEGPILNLVCSLQQLLQSAK